MSILFLVVLYKLRLLLNFSVCVVMSVDDSRSVIMKAVIHGAHDYLVKPVSIEALKNIWQHVVRQNKDEWKGKILDRLGNVEGAESKEGRLKSSKKRNDEEENEIGERNDTNTVKKARVLWSPELHEKFIQAINQLGGDSKSMNYLTALFWKFI